MKKIKYNHYQKILFSFSIFCIIIYKFPDRELKILLIPLKNFYQFVDFFHLRLMAKALMNQYFNLFANKNF